VVGTRESAGCGSSSPYLKRWEQLQFPKAVFSSYLEFRAMDKVQKPSDSEGEFVISLFIIRIIIEIKLTGVAFHFS
jgi:hypothetical protein